MKSSIFIIIHTFQPHCAARTALEIWPPYPFFFLRDDIHTRQTISVFACIGNTKKNAVVQHRAVFALMISLFVFCFASSFCAAWFLFGIRFDRPRLPGKSNGRGLCGWWEPVRVRLNAFIWDAAAAAFEARSFLATFCIKLIISWYGLRLTCASRIIIFSIKLIARCIS